MKAVTGGVAALKGQLIKGSGYIVGKGGKVKCKISHLKEQFNLNLINFQLLQASGDGVTNVGKKLINGAKVESHESHEDHHHHAGESSSCELVVL